VTERTRDRIMQYMSTTTKIGIVFDDGFVKSTLATAALFEEFGWRAAFAVLAHPEGFAPGLRVGDFSLWNELHSRGHLIHPHGYTHANLQSMDYPDAVNDLERCLGRFSEKLPGFNPQRAVYCFAYNSGTPALCQWLLAHAGAARVGGTGLLQKHDLHARIWHSHTFGPEDPGADLMDHIALAEQQRPAALFYVLHGVDGEAWGAIGLGHLRRALEAIRDNPSLEYWVPSPSC
jgi:peptidoglycan/xylan/chitin deacetylase (PgdA/CDA1 family)